MAHCLINYEKENLETVIHRPDIKSKEDLFDELTTEWINMALYGSDTTIRAMKSFLQNSDQKNFNTLVIQMRQELYGIKSNFKPGDLILKKN